MVPCGAPSMQCPTNASEFDEVADGVADGYYWTDMRNGVNAGDWTAVTPDPVNGKSFEGHGLDWLAAFGKKHNKEVGLPEWGLNTSGIDGGGGDDTYFMTQMADWIKASATGPAIFLNYDDGPCHWTYRVTRPAMTRTQPKPSKPRSAPAIDPPPSAKPGTGTLA
jgi:hypothetical protein